MFPLKQHTDLMQLKYKHVDVLIDDLTLSGQIHIIAANVNLIRESEMQSDLHINTAKCEIISRRPAPRTSQFSNFIPLASDEAQLLGASFFTDFTDTDCPCQLCTELNTTNHLCLLSTHDALILFRVVMARYGRGGKQWIRYDTAQNIAIRYNTIRFTVPKRSAVCNSQQSKINAVFSLTLSHVFKCVQTPLTVDDIRTLSTTFGRVRTWGMVRHQKSSINGFKFKLTH